MDTPKIPAPKDQGEKDILKSLVLIRDELLLRKRDRTTYVRSQDVLGLYDQTVAEVKKLNELRANKPDDEENQGTQTQSYFDHVGFDSNVRKYSG